MKLILCIVCGLMITGTINSFAVDKDIVRIYGDVVAMTPWLAEDQMLKCIVTRRSNTEEMAPPSYDIRIFDERGKVIYTEAVLGENVVTVFQYDIYGRNLVVLTTSGTFYKLDIYSSAKDKVQLALTVTSVNFPEIKYSHDTKRLVIGITESIIQKGHQVVKYKECGWEAKHSKFICRPARR